MKSYPKIDYHNKGIIGENVICFDKLDGSNFRAEYSRKRGFYKFGTRNVMIDKNDENFGHAIPLFLDKYNEGLSKIFRDKYSKIDSFVVFSEYIGRNSFAGRHEDKDKKEIVLFDVNQYKKGFLSTKEFIKNFGHLSIPEIIFDGEYSQKLIDDVKNNIYNLKEGVVAKNENFVVKIKTNEWLNKVKNSFGDKVLLEELNGDKNLFDELIKK